MSGSDEQSLTYLEVRFRVPRDACDAVSNFVVENICSGLILEDEEDAPEIGLVFYVPSNERTTYRPQLDTYLDSLVGDTLTETPSIRERPIQDVEWEEDYKRTVQPVTLARDVVIRPPWSAPPDDARYDVIIEPRMAFGTGKHETTRSCVRVIRELFQPGYRLLDLGCGSGILSILASLMGAKYIKAIDYDVTAVKNCQENFEINKIATRHDIVFGTLDKAQGDPPYDFVVANIIKSAILPVLRQLSSLTTPGGKLVLSGLLDKEDEEVTQALIDEGLTNFLVVPDNEWRTYVINKM